MQERIQLLKKPLTPEEQKYQFASDVDSGLSSNRKSLPSVYFYDARGSELFKQITGLPEYYLTRCEHELLENNAEDITGLITQNTAKSIRMIELGAGDSEKPFPIISGFLNSGRELEFTAIDISESALADLSINVGRNFPGLVFEGVVAEYFDALEYLKNDTEVTNLILFLGSNIGNLTRPRKLDFLNRLRENMNEGDYLLIGFDQKKPEDILINAYDDPQGVTRKFNLNLLERINRELGGTFDLSRFNHKADYNSEINAMESRLVSTCSQEVFIEELSKSFYFEESEAIHTEYSHKYDLSDISYFARSCEFNVIKNFTDSKNYFVCSLWQT